MSLGGVSCHLLEAGEASIVRERPPSSPFASSLSYGQFTVLFLKLFLLKKKKNEEVNGRKGREAGGRRAS